MRKTLATVSLSGDLPGKLAATAAARFDGIELFDNDLIASDLSPEHVAKRCADLGLGIDLFQPIRDVEGWDPAHFAAVKHRVRKKFAVMEKLGVGSCLVCSNALPGALDDLDTSAEQLHAIGDVAADHGFRIAFEALAWGTHINRVSQAWDVVRRADHPNVALAIDTFHMLSRGDGPAELAEIPGDQIAYVQIADAPRMDMNVLSWSRHHRCFPGQGDLDVAGIVAQTLRAGYRGPLSLEVFSDVVRTADARRTALDAMRSLLYLEEELRALRERSQTPARPRVDLFDPPPVPARVNQGFVEFAVEEADATIPNLLTALGFAHVGQHTTRPVQWWRNGQAHVCVTTLPVPEVDGATPRRPMVSAIALVTDEVRDVATRAQALLWPQVRRARGPYESALPGLDTPDGLHVFLSAPTGSADDWRTGYAAAPQGSADFEHGDWYGIDHIGVMVPSDCFPAEQSFYRSIFGLHAGDISEFIQPDGRMLSRPLRPTEGDVRIVLAAAENNGRHATHGINQVAFACRDIAAAVQRARAAGVVFLAVPDNYYEDLAARFTLEPAFVTHLRRHSLMYDEDAQGQLIHAYTTTINDSFYIELVQRDNGYDGYGIPNTHVRLAVQARS